MGNACILLAGGTSTRFGGTDKTLVPVDGMPAFIHSLKAFEDSGCVEQYIITYSSIDHKLALEKAIEKHCSSIESITLVEGGSRRQDSVYNGLKALESQDIEDVFIHDSARILITKELITSLNTGLYEHKAVCPAKRVTDTIKTFDPSKPEFLKNLERNHLWATETPQAFKLNLIRRAHEHVKAQDLHITDDIAAVSAINEPVHIVENQESNIKLTYPQDLDLVEFLIQKRKNT